ncbi:MAG: MOSC domain-containing protein [Paracoccaceae bacterium]
MTLLTPTDLTGEITWLGCVPVDPENIQSVTVQSVNVGWEGFEGEEHSGLTRPACVRVKKQYARNLEIRNTRQISILSEEEMTEIAARLEIPRIDPQWVGANMVLRGIPDFTLIPPSSRLIFEGGVSLTVDTENAPCKYPAEQIEAAHPGHGKAFPGKARNKRGVTAWVERIGALTVGQTCVLHIPPQRIYAHA